MSWIGGRECISREGVEELRIGVVKVRYLGAHPSALLSCESVNAEVHYGTVLGSLGIEGAASGWHSRAHKLGSTGALPVGLSRPHERRELGQPFHR